MVSGYPAPSGLAWPCLSPSGTELSSKEGRAAFGRAHTSFPMALNLLTLRPSLVSCPRAWNQEGRGDRGPVHLVNDHRLVLAVEDHQQNGDPIFLKFDAADSQPRLRVLLGASALVRTNNATVVVNGRGAYRSRGGLQCADLEVPAKMHA